MKNPYTMLGIRQTATDNEIREALKQKIKLYCREDESKKNADGEYLREIFTKAAKSLLNKEERAEIDSEIEKNNKRHGLVTYTENSTNQNVKNNTRQNAQGYNNQHSYTQNKELVKPNTSSQTAKSKSDTIYSDRKSGISSVFNTTPNMQNPSNLPVSTNSQSILKVENSYSVPQQNIQVTQKNVNMYLRQMIAICLNANNLHTTNSNDEDVANLLSLENGYVIIGEDGSCLLAKHSKRRDEHYHNWFIHQLSDMLTGQVYHEEEQRIDNTTSWMNGKCISIFGVKSRVIPIMKFIPMNMLRNNKASKNDLQRLISAIEMILTSNPEVLECLINPDGSTKKTITGSSKSLRIDQY